MVSLPPWPAAASLVAALLSALFVRYLWPYRRESGGWLFVATIACQTLLCLSYGVALLVFDPVLREALEVPYWFGLNFLAVSFLGFALAYTGRRSLVTSAWFYGLAGLALASVAVVATNPLHGLAWGSYRVEPVFGAAAAAHPRSVWVFMNLTGAGLVVAAGVFLLVDTFLSYGPLYRGQTVAVALSTVPPMLAIYAWTFRLGPVEHLHLAPLVFPAHLAFDYYAFFDRDMFELTPAARRAGERAVIDDLASPVLVLDGAGRVIDLNRAAEDVFGAGPDALGDPVEAVLGERLAGGVDGTVSIDTPEGRREYAVSSSPVADTAGDRVGHTVVLQDVTEANRRKQRLAVFNRILRHNVRNDMTVVRGRAQTIRETSTDPAVAGHAEAIVESGDALLDLAADAREFERAMAGDLDGRPVDVGALLEEIVDDLTGEGTADVTVAVDTDRRALADPELLSVVLSNVVENALEHAGESPSVTVRVDHEGGAGNRAGSGGAGGGTESDDDAAGPVDGDGDAGEVVVTVTDDGPGISDHELGALRDGESALQHGQGIGLRVITWGATAIGADVTFDVEDGTTVTIRLPAAPATNAADEV